MDLYDLLLPAGSGVYTQTTGVAGNQVFTVQFKNVGLYNGGLAPVNFVTFEMKLFEATGNIEFDYPSALPVASTVTIGIQNAAGTVATPAPGHNNTATGATANTSYTFSSIPAGPFYTLTVTATGNSTFGDTVSVKSLTDNTATVTAGSIATTNGVTMNNSGTGTITGTIGGPNTIPAYVGFTGGSGSVTAEQDINNWVYTSGATNINYSSGFAVNNLALNGGASVVGTKLQLTDNLISEARSAWTPTPVPAASFDTTFQWSYGAVPPGADGFTFAVQNSGSTALGDAGGGLGYQNIPGSGYSFQFNLYNGVSTFGMGQGGAILHATSLVASGIDFHTNPTHTYEAHIVNNGLGTITVGLWDRTSNGTAVPNFTQVFSISTTAGSLTKQGAGRLNLTGTSSVPALVSGGELGGSGTIGTVTNNATVKAGSGTSTTIFNTGNLSGGGAYNFRLNGTTAGTSYDQISATGSIDLTGATLTGSLGAYVPAGGDVLTIIKNVSNSIITGTFTGYAEGATVTIGGSNFVISYLGGAGGHDVTLSIAATGPAPYIMSVIVNGGPIGVIDSFGNTPNLLGQNSVVVQLLVTFNVGVTLDPGAFSINNLWASVSASGTQPSQDPVTVSAAVVPLTGNTQWVLTFGGAGVITRDNTVNGTGGIGNIFNTIKNGFYQLATDLTKVHANGNTGVDPNSLATSDFWALYGVYSTFDYFLSGDPAFVGSVLTVQGGGLGDIYLDFGSETDSPAPPYQDAYDWDLSGTIDGVDLGIFYLEFGTEWDF